MHKSNLKKALGQNLFKNIPLLNKIVDLVIQSNPKLIIEIGPGLGAFTKEFVGRNIKVIAIEKDNVFAAQLKRELPQTHFAIVNADVLKISYSEILKLAKNHFSIELTAKNVICFGALPYNISKPIIDSAVQNESVFDKAFFIIQYEVANRIIGRPKNSSLACFLQLFSSTKDLIKIPPSAFYPQPKVNSSLIMIEINGDKNPDINKDKFSSYLKTAFRNPRKKLLNNLRDPYNNTIKKLVTDVITEPFLSARAEDLSFEQHLEIFKVLGD